MIKHLTAHGIKLLECHVFDKLRSSESGQSNRSTSSCLPAAERVIENGECQEEEDGTESCSTSERRTPFTLAALGGKFNEEKVNECHRAVTKFVVKGLHPFSTVEQPEFRDMVRTFDSRYKPPSRDSLANRLIPAWYQVERDNLMSALREVSTVAITADGWTSLVQDHYLTVTLHFVNKGTVLGKVLQTKAVYECQTGDAVAEEIESILNEFGVRSKVVAATVDNAANMDVALRKLRIRKIGCFAHTLNLAAQKINRCNTISNWAARVRSIVVWIKRCHMAKVVLREKQQLLDLPPHALIMDVKTRWNSLYLMVERFYEQFPAIQAVIMDPRIKKQTEKERLVEKLQTEDLRRAKEFIDLMSVLYTSTLCVSSEKNPTCGQIIPILKKLESHFAVQPEDSAFAQNIKQKVWTDLSTRYKDEAVYDFLEEATVMDPRFKLKMNSNTVIWDRLKMAAIVEDTEKRFEEDIEDDDQSVEVEQEDRAFKERDSSPPNKRHRKTALEELFAEEEQNLLSTPSVETQTFADRLELEIQMYRGIPPISVSADPTLWWWQKKDTMPLLAHLAEKYLCVQASSTPSERVFSTAGDTIRNYAMLLDLLTSRTILITILSATMIQLNIYLYIREVVCSSPFAVMERNYGTLILTF
ncbi:hypothetical protein WMY93_000474 [Mugilogobius chulae]|uniref:HAT C-terminal dimerisation domain-containing protein n=1 Tax=Mugilogobius chulae TaxID=88201 RepID=A0AAW0PZ14_9GOBI